MFYLYALPKGPLAAQIDSFRLEYVREFGANKAHDYPLHVTLTRGFNAIPEQVEDYGDAITRHFAGARAFTVGNFKQVADKQLVILELAAPELAVSTRSWVEELGRSDIQIVERQFHITIAWQTTHFMRIFELAQELVDLSLAVKWEVSLCQRIDQAAASPIWDCPPGLRLI